MARKDSLDKTLKENSSRPIFESLRTPGAPPGHPLSRAKPDEIARPAGRKAKHKQRPELPIEDEE